MKRLGACCICTHSIHPHPPSSTEPLAASSSENLLGHPPCCGQSHFGEAWSSEDSVGKCILTLHLLAPMYILCTLLPSSYEKQWEKTPCKTGHQTCRNDQKLEWNSNLLPRTNEAMLTRKESSNIYVQLIIKYNPHIYIYLFIFCGRFFQQTRPNITFVFFDRYYESMHVFFSQGRGSDGLACL